MLFCYKTVQTFYGIGGKIYEVCILIILALVSVAILALTVGARLLIRSRSIPLTPPDHIVTVLGSKIRYRVRKWEAFGDPLAWVRRFSWKVGKSYFYAVR